MSSFRNWISNARLVAASGVTLRWLIPASVAVVPFAIAGIGCSDTADKPVASNASAQSAATASRDNAAVTQPTKTVASTKGESSAPTTGATKRPLFEGWGTPSAVIVLSGEQDGYLEPCGCSETQSGGMSRRADLFEKIRAKGWPVAAVDVGNLTKRSRRQDQIKFEAIVAAQQQLGGRAIAVGPKELALGPDYLLTQQVIDPTTSDASPNFISANVTLFDSPEIGTPRREKLIDVGGVKVGVTAVLGRSLHETVSPAGVTTNITLASPEDSLVPVISNLKQAGADILVLLSHGSVAEAQELAARFPEFAIVLTAGGPDDPKPEPTPVGKSWVLQTGHKGKSVGVLGIYPADTSPRFRFELVELDNVRFRTNPAMELLMKQYQQRLQEEAISVSPDLVLPVPSGDTYAGAEKCGECHKQAYAKWSKSKHAAAFASLKVGRKGQEANWVSRVYDPECLACHVTGWDPQQVNRYESGYLSEAETPHLIGQQCENCHGPGAKHSELEWKFQKDLKSVDRAELLAARKAQHLDLEVARKNTCYKCHDNDNSPHFNFDKYWAEVRHPWRD